MEYKEILNLMKEMDSTGLSKLEIEKEGFRICIEKAVPVMNTVWQGSHSGVSASGCKPDTVIEAQSSVTMQTVSASATEADLKQQEELSGKKLVAPMVGTFYAAPAPDQPAFVKVGDKVKKGQTICIIEAMKLMNEIESEMDGEIVKVLAGNEEMVEFGQPLFLIK